MGSWVKPSAGTGTGRILDTCAIPYFIHMYDLEEFVDFTESEDLEPGLFWEAWQKE